MSRLSLLPLAALSIMLAGCSASDATQGNASEAVSAVETTDGTAWSEQVTVTELGVRMGNPDAAITLVEYGSYTCPHCAAFNKESHDPLIADFVDTGKINFEYRNMVRDPVDLAATLIAHCGGAETFFPLSNQVFGYQDQMIGQIQAAGNDAYQGAVTAAPNERLVKMAELTGLIEFAKRRGLAEDQVRTCLANVEEAEKIVKNSQDVIEKYPAFPGTPSFLLNGTLLDNTASWSALLPKLRDAGA